jgi:hypothetical protein
VARNGHLTHFVLCQFAVGVTNLEGNQGENHVKRVAEFAIEMINEAGQILIDEEEPLKGHINIRVGFHSGAHDEDVSLIPLMKRCWTGESDCSNPLLPQGLWLAMSLVL